MEKAGVRCCYDETLTCTRYLRAVCWNTPTAFKCDIPARVVTGAIGEQPLDMDKFLEFADKDCKLPLDQIDIEHMTSILDSDGNGKITSLELRTPADSITSIRNMYFADI